MDRERFLKNILPGNYFITKSMEITKLRSSGTLWYTKKFIVLYYYIFLNDNITTLSAAREICEIFDDYINSLPENLREAAMAYFYSPDDVADLRSDKFRLFGDFAGNKQFADDNERLSYYECAKKYYFAFLMGSGGQNGVNRWIKDHLLLPDFRYSDIDRVIAEWAEANRNNPESNGSWLKEYRAGRTDAAVRGMRNDYMAFVRNERQILFYYGFFHSKSDGYADREFSSLTPIGELALKSNFYELIAIWEHQKLKMLSQPVNIEISNPEECQIDNFDSFRVNANPYLTILKALRDSGGFTKDAYQYVISRLPEYPDDGIDTSDAFVAKAKDKVAGFHRHGDNSPEDFHKELSKYILGIRSDLRADRGCTPIGLCKFGGQGLKITDSDRLARLIEVYSVLCEYKSQKYAELIEGSEAELKRQYVCNATGKDYRINPKIKIKWDMYNIHSDLFILLTAAVLILEGREHTVFTKASAETFADGIRRMCPNMLKILGLTNKLTLKGELKRIASALADRSYDAYLTESAESYDSAVAGYMEGSLADLERMIKEESCLAPVYVDGVRKRNMRLIGLMKSYNSQKYTTDDGVLTCECCGNPTFVTFRNESYMEYHHIIPFGAYDGPDHSLNIVALCPMCHRKIHFIKPEDKHSLYNNVAANSYGRLSIETRLTGLYDEHRLKSYQLEYLLADNAIDEAAYNRILHIA